MYLLDTNVWLERLLEQQKSGEVKRFLDEIPSERLFMTDFTFHSIALILTQLRKTEALLRFVQDTFVEGAVSLIRLDPGDTPAIVSTTQRFGLDFDDAYQYVAAERYGLLLISFDADLDRTDRGRKSPAGVLSQ